MQPWFHFDLQHVSVSIIIIIIKVTMPEFENREDKSASENAKALKHIFKSKMKSMKEEKWENKALHGQYPGF